VSSSSNEVLKTTQNNMHYFSCFCIPKNKYILFLSWICSLTTSAMFTGKDAVLKIFNNWPNKQPNNNLANWQTNWMKRQIVERLVVSKYRRCETQNFIAVLMETVTGAYSSQKIPVHKHQICFFKACSPNLYLRSADFFRVFPSKLRIFYFYVWERREKKVLHSVPMSDSLN
jgi:hypothetical protein